jgi:hypothetical protein
MAAALETKRAGESIKLYPYFIGTTKVKVKGVEKNQVHYVLIKFSIAKRIGLTKTSILRPGTDSIVDGVVFRNVPKRKNSKSKTGVNTAKRGLHQYSKKITVILDNLIKKADGTKEFESYTIGFGQSIPLRTIIKFLYDNCPKVVRIRTQGNMYGVR